jgi:hypothetical protein
MTRRPLDQRTRAIMLAVLGIDIPPHAYLSWYRAPRNVRIPPRTWFTSFAVYARGKITHSVHVEWAQKPKTDG